MVVRLSSPMHGASARIIAAGLWYVHD